jgi:hypothetical protein
MNVLPQGYSMQPIALEDVPRLARFVNAYDRRRHRSNAPLDRGRPRLRPDALVPREGRRRNRRPVPLRSKRSGGVPRRVRTDSRRPTAVAAPRARQGAPPSRVRGVPSTRGGRGRPARRFAEPDRCNTPLRIGRDAGRRAVSHVRIGAPPWGRSDGEDPSRGAARS